jgi:hypothetical protein
MVAFLVFSRGFLIRPRARARPRARMPQPGLIRSRTPGIAQDRSASIRVGDKEEGQAEII